MNNNFPCKCGHLKKHHEYTSDGKHLFCNFKNVDFDVKNPNRIMDIWADLCIDFVPDNLRYLEQKALDK